MKRFLLIVFFITYKISLAQSFEIYNQDTINMIDANNLKQGFWIFWGKMKKLPGYADDSKVEEGTFQNSRKVGLWKKYFPNGKVENEISYQNGRPNGRYVMYYPNGQVQEEAVWKGTKQVGTFKRYYENGNVAQEFTMNENGKKDGIQRYYYENGKIMIEGEFKNGQESGIIKEYYENGDLRAEKNFANGMLDAASTKVYEPKKPLAKEEPEPVKAVGPPPVVNKADETVNMGSFNGNGYAKLFDGNKQVSKDGIFSNYRLVDGKHYIYDKNGILQRVAIYKNGAYVGDGVIEQK